MITIEDWSHIRKTKIRHALFCVAYRRLLGDSFAAACRTTAKRLNCNEGRLRLLARHYIKLTGENTK